MVFHVSGGRLGVWVVPRCVLILLPVYQNRVVTSLALPWTAGGRRTWPQELSLDRFVWKIDVSLDRLVGLTLGQYLPIPNCLCHSLRPVFSRIYSNAARSSGRHSTPISIDYYVVVVTEMMQKRKKRYTGDYPFVSPSDRRNPSCSVAAVGNRSMSAAVCRINGCPDCFSVST